MKACAVLFLLLPVLAVADTARIAVNYLGDLYLVPEIPDSYSVNSVQEVCCG